MSTYLKAFFLTSTTMLLCASSIIAHADAAYSDDASNYTSSYDGKNASTGFGPFVVTATNGKPPFSGTFIGNAKGTERNQGDPNPESIDTNSQAFGFYANGGPAASVMITRSFNSGLRSPGDTFSINFVTGLNDTGEVGITLYTNDANVGNFVFVAGTGFMFDGRRIGSQFVPGALHLMWTVEPSGKLKLNCSGAMTYTGAGNFSGTILGFKVYATNSGPGGSDHDGYFNSISEIVKPTGG